MESRLPALIGGIAGASFSTLMDLNAWGTKMAGSDLRLGTVVCALTFGFLGAAIAETLAYAVRNW
jgi:hypothetical protein